MIQLPIIGAVLEASGMMFEKKMLKRKNLDYKNYTVFEFLSIVAVMVTFVWFFWRIDSAAYLAKNLLIFGAVVLSSVLANLLVFYSLKREKISEFEPVWLMQPLFTIILAFIFYSSERNWTIVILALIASVSLIASHVKKSHFVYDKYMLAVLAGGFFFAVELVLSNSILSYYSGFTFYFLRCFFILAVTFMIYRPTFRVLSRRNIWMFLAVGFIWVFYRVIMYYGYENYGIVFTTILFLLSPVFIFLSAMIFFKERSSWRNIVSSAVIVACVAAAIFLGE
ncbi:DMT family transporter [Candidatus Pacearchaeota archaeon]|nr:DMT family transporter [Candidatus Pacearchaeota archaeon]